MKQRDWQVWRKINERETEMRASTKKTKSEKNCTHVLVSQTRTKHNLDETSADKISIERITTPLWSGLPACKFWTPLSAQTNEYGLFILLNASARWRASFHRGSTKLSSAWLLSQPEMSGPDPSPRRRKKRTIYQARIWEKNNTRLSFGLAKKSAGRFWNNTLFSFSSFEKVLHWRGRMKHLLPKQTQCDQTQIAEMAMRQ